MAVSRLSLNALRAFRGDGAVVEQPLKVARFPAGANTHGQLRGCFVGVDATTAA